MNKNKTILIIVAVLVLIVGFFGFSNRSNDLVVDGFGLQSGNNKIVDLSEEEINWLVFMRGEEKLARDVYRTLGDKWGMAIFSNIAASEQTHTDAVRNLLSSYNITDPVTNDEAGVFQSEILQKLYTNLVKEGEQSLVQALKVGAEIEDLDIRDLDIAMSETNNENILQVYANLQKGSRNHLRSFVRQIESNGEKYAPKYISLEEYNSIISSEQERGRN